MMARFGRMAPAALLLAGGLAVAGLVEGVAMAAEPLAKTLFGAQKMPAEAAPESIGFYSKGCFAGGVALPMSGPHWQVMRPSRNRRWGHPAMIAFLETLSEKAAADGWKGLLVGDVSQPRGGPMASGHASHQVGLDADIWFTQMPDRILSDAERESMSARSLLKPGPEPRALDERLWTPAYEAVLRDAASYPQVERIFVAPAIKKKLCETVRDGHGWMGKIRPYWGHDEHFHVRISCQPGSPGCKPQAPVAAGDGCDKSLDWWFTDEPWRPATGPQKPRPRDVMTMASLPKECQAVLNAPAPASIAEVTMTGPRLEGIAAGMQPVQASAFVAVPASKIPLPTPRPTR